MVAVAPAAAVHPHHQRRGALRPRLRQVQLQPQRALPEPLVHQIVHPLLGADPRGGRGARMEVPGHSSEALSPRARH